MVFERLFGTADSALMRKHARGAPSTARALDFVRDDPQQLAGKLGSPDRRKLDEYLSAVREIERANPGRWRKIPGRDAGYRKASRIPITLPDYAKLMYDLPVVAFQADLTRVTTLMLGREEACASIQRSASRPASSAHAPPRQSGLDEKVTQINCLHTECSPLLKEANRRPMGQLICVTFSIQSGCRGGA